MPEDTIDRTPKRAPGETREMVRVFALAGKGVREIAKLADISTQAANAHLKKLRDAGELPQEEASA